MVPATFRERAGRPAGGAEDTAVVGRRQRVHRAGLIGGPSVSVLTFAPSGDLTYVLWGPGCLTTRAPIMPLEAYVRRRSRSMQHSTTPRPYRA